jgi:hypothetical protein
MVAIGAEGFGMSSEGMPASIAAALDNAPDTSGPPIFPIGVPL